ncbi:MAG TPA: hypothetical protein VFV78_02040 [Vicinamibacterales bacterium]|nr:hypothetical protein [Vicinamibacterales bacterium]
MIALRGAVGLSLLATLVLARPARAQAPEVISNDSVVQMVAGKVPKDVILAKIHSTANSFDVTPNGLIGLTKSKLDKQIINAMIAAKADTREVLNNEAVIAMVSGGVNKDVTLFKIHSTKCRFDLTAAGLVTLTQNKVPQDIVKAMLNVEVAPIEEPPPPPPAPAPAPSRGAAPAASRGTTAPGRGAAAPATTPAATPARPAAADASQAVTFTATPPMKTVFDKIRAHLEKASGTTVRQADAVLGQITAVRTYRDETTEHESRIVVKVTSSAGHSTVRVSVFDKSRKMATPPGAWSVEKFDSTQTTDLVDSLKMVAQAR